HGGATETPAFFGMFVTSQFAQFAKILVLMGAALSIVLSSDYMRREKAQRFEYPVLIVYATLGMMMMISANDLIALYIGLELQSLALYVVASIRRDTLRSTEAGLKYFVLGALSSGMLLYGCSLIYGFAGTTDFAGLAGIFTTLDGDVPVGLVFGLVFLISGLAFKVSAVPFHMWTPDVYEGAPTPVTALFAIAPKVAAICLFLRVMVGPFGELIDQWQQVIVVISILSMGLGAFAALVQTNIKRLMAYSSIGHMGYALVGVAAGNEAGASGVLIYMAIYLFMNVGTFACILAMRQQGRMVEGINDLAGLSKSHPMMAFALLIFMFSMAGVPPLAGFFGKWFVFLAAIDAGLYTLAILGVMASVVSAFYYLRIVKIMYFDEAVEPLDSAIPGDLRFVMYVATAVTLLFFLVPSHVVELANGAAASLMGG
ncbi:MAG: NADH-quinone oxidoreductase subunit NuoN, partial [Alphaproteobacteria bacterium]|nr:NADH-quinone oxidoreductase subunit NuoN [Alphaproteobacteria bacterium]